MRLKQLHRQAVAEVDNAISAGDRQALRLLGASNKQARLAIQGGANGARFRGTIIDKHVKNRAKNTFGLKSLEAPGNFQYGPDFWNIKTMRAWDMTTAPQWQNHVNKYIANPGLNRPVWRQLKGLIH